ncbi:putative nitrogen fixation protein NifT [Marinobacterium sp. YM272]|uniref:Nitrogen fixation protein NifT n=2 Tax=Marinobacterium TaxID=48075 RepID=A0A1H5YP12_9GAMM|nr:MULTISPECIES: putative nitrogen fixation protein NifT [Marinobacterium]TCK08374.1 nitrogen fixation protein NifT [Marinobacterium mangrovicola]SEG25744.1 nitrogen fixation protein NifT [Marinobacterium lutimaris]
MPNVMIRQNEGKMTLYVAKKDQEDEISSIEFTSDDSWGGTIELTDGTRYYIDPLDAPPKLPITLRAKRG